MGEHKATTGRVKGRATDEQGASTRQSQGEPMASTGRVRSEPGASNARTQGGHKATEDEHGYYPEDFPNRPPTTGPVTAADAEPAGLPGSVTPEEQVDAVTEPVTEAAPADSPAGGVPMKEMFVTVGRPADSAVEIFFCLYSISSVRCRDQSTHITRKVGAPNNHAAHCFIE